MEFVEQAMPGVHEIRPNVQTDNRGAFVKTFHKDRFEELGLETGFVEEYHSISRKGVLRGLHFQSPPHDHVKVVYCISGVALDALVDLRLGSPTYGQYAIFELRGDQANMIYIPRGVAHGFYVTSESAIVVYKTNAIHMPRHDTGIRWDSAGIPWPNRKPIISERDGAFAPLQEFQSPFRYEDG